MGLVFMGKAACGGEAEREAGAQPHYLSPRQGSPLFFSLRGGRVPARQSISNAQTGFSSVLQP